jgi:hypothetical protein
MGGWSLARPHQIAKDVPTERSPSQPHIFRPAPNTLCGLSPTAVENSRRVRRRTGRPHASTPLPVRERQPSSCKPDANRPVNALFKGAAGAAKFAANDKASKFAPAARRIADIFIASARERV